MTEIETAPIKRTLDEWIKFRGSSNAKLAKALKKTPSLVSKQRNHHRGLSAKDLKIYAKELEFDANDLILR